MPRSSVIRVLIVDDDPVDGKLFVERLRQAGMRPIIPPSTDVETALRCLDENDAQVVLLDLLLGTDSPERTVLAIPRFMARGCAVIIVSAADDARIARAAKSQGAKWISKTGLTSELLAEVVYEALATRKTPLDETPPKGIREERTSAGLVVIGSDGKRIFKVAWAALAKARDPILACLLTAGSLLGVYHGTRPDASAAEPPRQERPSDPDLVKKNAERITTLETRAAIGDVSERSIQARLVRIETDVATLNGNVTTLNATILNWMAAENARRQPK